MIAPSIDPEALATMRQRGGTWYAYQNAALDSANGGHVAVLRCGTGCTFTEPPEKHPTMGMGWRYLLIGAVNLDTGSIDPI